MLHGRQHQRIVGCHLRVVYRDHCSRSGTSGAAATRLPLRCLCVHIHGFRNIPAATNRSDWLLRCPVDLFDLSVRATLKGHHRFACPAIGCKSKMWSWLSRRGIVRDEKPTFPPLSRSSARLEQLSGRLHPRLYPPLLRLQSMGCCPSHCTTALPSSLLPASIANPSRSSAQSIICVQLQVTDSKSMQVIIIFSHSRQQGGCLKAVKTCRQLLTH